MSKPFSNILVLPDGRATRIAGEFSQPEWATLVQCHNTALSLGGNSLVEQADKGPYELLADVATGDALVSFDTTDAELYELAKLMKVFVLIGEPFFLPMVCNRMKRRIAIPELQEYLDTIVLVFDGGEVLRHIEVGAGTAVVNSYEFFVKWLRSKLGLGAPELATEVNEALAPINPVIWRHSLLQMLMSKVACLQHVCALISALDSGKPIAMPNQPIVGLHHERTP